MFGLKELKKDVERIKELLSYRYKTATEFSLYNSPFSGLYGIPRLYNSQTRIDQIEERISRLEMMCETNFSRMDVFIRQMGYEWKDEEKVNIPGKFVKKVKK